MKKVNKKRLIGILASAGIAFCGAGIYQNASADINANADAATPVIAQTATLTMTKGASIRIPATFSTTEAGIRWEIRMSASDYNGLKAENENVSFGVLIAPVEYHTQHPLNDAANLTGDTAVYNWATPSAENESGWEYTPENGKTRIVNLSTKEMTLTTDATEYVWYASLINLLGNNYARNFIGVGYIYDGEEYRFAQENDNVRSISYVAQQYVSANADTEKAKTVKTLYIDPYLGNDTTYTVEHVKISADGTESVADTVTADTKVGDPVTATAKTYDGYATWGAMPSDVATVNGATKLQVKYYTDIGVKGIQEQGAYNYNVSRKANCVSVSVNNGEAKLLTNFSVKSGKTYRMTLQYKGDAFYIGDSLSGTDDWNLGTTTTDETTGVVTRTKDFTNVTADADLILRFYKGAAATIDVYGVTLTEMARTNVIDSTYAGKNGQTITYTDYYDRTNIQFAAADQWDYLGFKTSIQVTKDQYYKISFKLKITSGNWDAFDNVAFYDSVSYPKNDTFFSGNTGFRVKGGATIGSECLDEDEKTYRIYYVSTSAASATGDLYINFKSYTTNYPTVSFDISDLKVVASPIESVTWEAEHGTVFTRGFYFDKVVQEGKGAEVRINSIYNLEEGKKYAVTLKIKYEESGVSIFDRHTDSTNGTWYTKPEADAEGIYTYTRTIDSAKASEQFVVRIYLRETGNLSAEIYELTVVEIS